MRTQAFLAVGLALASACGQGGDGDIESSQPFASIGSGGDPNATIAYTQVAKSVGIDRSTEPASAGTFNASGTIAYGSWLADLDGDGRLDYYAVNHGQTPHLSGLFINNGSGGFGKNLFSVSLQPSTTNFPNLNLTNEMRFVGDLTGDGKVDLFFVSWSGLGASCINQGNATHTDWSGPGYICYGTTDGIAFADVNGDGKIDVLSFDTTNFDAYTAYYSQTAKYMWRLNNGDPNINNWPTTTNFLSLRVTDPNAVAAPFVDLNGDGIPDKIVGVAMPSSSRGPYGTSTGGQQVFIGTASGTYTQLSNTGLEGVTAPITRIEDVNDDGCLDVGTDITGYRDNQTWYVQNKTGNTCTVTFTATPRTQLPFYPGFKRYSVDVDNSGLLSKAVIIHTAYGSNDGKPGGVSIYRKAANGSYSPLTPTQTGININGTDTSEFYADNLSPGDWNDDGRIDFAGSGEPEIPNTDSGFALWTSNLATTNSWIKVTLPTVTGFFAGSAMIEVFDAGFAGDQTHLVTPAKVLYPGKAWASQVYHFGIATRSAVDVRVTFPDGRQVVRASVTPTSRLSIQPTDAPPPPDTTPPQISISSAAFTPTVSDNVGVVQVQWFFDGTLSSTVTAPPFGFQLNLTPVAGSHSLVARAFDAAGNFTDSAPITIGK